MILVLLHVLYSLSKYLYRNYHAGKKTESHEQDLCEMRDEDLVLPLKVPLTFSPPAYIQRYNEVLNVLLDPRYEGEIRKIVDFGCAELSFLMFLKSLTNIEEILCVDIDENILERSSIKAKPYTMDYINRRKTPLTIEICQGNVTQNDARLQNIDAVVCIELIEHMHPNELIDFPYNIFGYVMPKVAIITTPNADFNVLFPNFSGYRHPDHKFEWTREQFQDWAQNIVRRYPSYSVTFSGVASGPKGTEKFGSCSQMAVFHLESREKRVQVPGMDDLFKTLNKFDYPVYLDTRSEKQKIMDDALYYINFLSYEGTEQLDEIPLSRVLPFIKNFPALTLEALRSVVVEHGMNVEDREVGPVALPYERFTSESDASDVLECSTAVDFSDVDVATAWNESDFGSHSSLNESLRTDEESSHLPHTFITQSSQLPDSSDWNGDCSIVIPQNRSISLANNSFFNGEVPSILNESHFSEKSTDIDDIKHSTINDSTESAVEGFSSNSIPPISCNEEVNGKTQIIQSDALTIMFSATPSIKLESNNTTKALVDVVTIEPALTQEDEVNLRSMQRTASTLNCQPHLSVSRSSTSPEPLYLSFELSDYLQDNSINQNSLCQSKSLLDDTFHQSEVNEAVENIDLVECANGFKGNPTQEDHARENGINLMENASNAKVNGSCNIERVMKKQLCDNSSTSSKICSSDFQNRPKFTSSPKKLPNIEQMYAKNEDFVSLDSSMLSSITEASKENVLNTDNGLLADTIQVSRSTVEMIDLCTTVSNSTDVDKDRVSKCSIDCSTDHKTQQELHFENKGFSISTPIKNEGINRGFAAESSTINHETDASHVQNVDTYVPSMDDTMEYGERSVASASSNSYDFNAKAYLDNMLASDQPRTSISKRSLSPPRGSLIPKLRRNSKCSAECAKNASTLENKFVPCSSSSSGSNSEDASANVQFASVSRNEEHAGCVTKESASRDVNISNISKATDSVEMKASSPVETPPNSWSPEIMDSGYPNTASAQDITPEYDLSSIAQDHISDSESPSVAEAPRFGILEAAQVENGDLANNNRDDEGNNMMAVDADDNEDLQPFIDVLENDLENENDIYVMQNGFPVWLLRILDMANPLDFDVQDQQDPGAVNEVADDVNYVNPDEGFDSNSSENESDVAHNEMENDNEE